MVEIKENQELYVENVLCFRGFVTQEQLPSVGENMDAYIRSVGARRVANPITAIYDMQGAEIDICMVLPIDKAIESTSSYTFKKYIKIANAVVASYKGDQAGMNDVANQLNQYMIRKGLEPLTVAYNVTKNNFTETDMEVDMYVGVNPNVL